MPFRWFFLALFCLIAACSRAPEATQTSANAADIAPQEPMVQRKQQAEIDWSPIRLEAGDASIDCTADYLAGDGKPVLSLLYLDLRTAMQDCRATGLVRLRYKGKVTASFAALAERAGKVAGDLGIGKRILDIDSAGGSVEAAMRAGDAIGENDWTIWVRGDSVCHSACVLLLAAGDMRVIVGPVGIHRMIRVKSTATSRKELGEELRKLSDELRNYLERNGASIEVYDLMTTVPNRTLRILTDEELENFGLSGANAVEDDLDRIRLARRCGIKFLQRRDAFRHAYEQSCVAPADEQHQDVADINACGLSLRAKFGFPDPACPVESPMAELDGAILMPREEEPLEAEQTAAEAKPAQAEKTAHP
ncbi:MAG: hypothetical protein KUL77_04785 [Thermomonas sp.]|uniref:COG3904 family protein n=1 Tax=Thermomonas sp. TaxID=1971895 RepID=UPI001EC525D0|nr:hypothetical protein [Thermomonas sp.]MBV2208865.1 hypothetical protein [Thermomonas sp.]